MELTTATKAALEGLRVTTSDRDELTTLTLLGAPVEPHACDAGWVYDEDDKAKRCAACEDADRRHASRQRMTTAGIPDRYLDVTWDDLDLVDPLPAIKAAATRIPAVIKSGHNAVFAGPPGTGKTQAACLLIRAAAEAGYTAAIENIGRAAMRIRAAYGQETGDTEAALTTRLSDVDLLVLDDVGAGEAGEGKLELRLLYFITEARQAARRPTVITTNLTAEQLRKFLQVRIANRLMPLETFAFTHGKNFRVPTGGTTWRAP